MSTPMQTLNRIRHTHDDYEEEEVILPRYKDFIKSILITKLSLFDMTDDNMFKHYSPYIIVHGILRKHPEHALILNDLQGLGVPRTNSMPAFNIPNKMHYQFLFYAIPIKKAP